MDDGKLDRDKLAQVANIVNRWYPGTPEYEDENNFKQKSRVFLGELGLAADEIEGILELVSKYLLDKCSRREINTSVAAAFQELAVSGKEQDRWVFDPDTESRIPFVQKACAAMLSRGEEALQSLTCRATFIMSMTGDKLAELELDRSWMTCTVKRKLIDKAQAPEIGKQHLAVGDRMLQEYDIIYPLGTKVTISVVFLTGRVTIRVPDDSPDVSTAVGILPEDGGTIEITRAEYSLTGVHESEDHDSLADPHRAVSTGGKDNVYIGKPNVTIQYVGDRPKPLKLACRFSLGAVAEGTFKLIDVLEKEPDAPWLVSPHL